MTLDSVQLEDEDFQILVPELERSFDVELDRDLRHVLTAGDLFEELLKRRAPAESGDRCDTAITFFRLRRFLAGEGLNPRAWPSTPLRRQGLPSPRKIRAMVEAEIGLHLPQPAMSIRGCSLLLALAASIIAAWMIAWPAVIPVIAIAMIVVVKLDQGAWSGQWETLGSLARAVSVRNVLRLSADGARSSRDDWWRAYTELLTEYALVDAAQVTRDQIGPQTRFVFS